MVYLQRQKLRLALRETKQYEVKKTRATLEIREKNGILFIKYEKEPQTFIGTRDKETNKFTKEKGNMTIRHILSIMESELVFDGKNRSNFNAEKGQVGPLLKIK